MMAAKDVLQAISLSSHDKTNAAAIVISARK